MIELRTERLLLRQWREDDLLPFAQLNADPEVMHYFPSSLTREQSDQLAHRAAQAIDERGWGLWAVEAVEVAPFIGFVGLAVPSFEAHFTPAVEVGWRLAKEQWGRGYATEAAGEALAFGFGELGLDEIVSFTSMANERSQRVMRRLGMVRTEEDDFDHPALPAGHPLRRHVLYRLRQALRAHARAPVRGNGA